MMDINDLLGAAVPQREVTTQCEERIDFRCEHCGFTGIARATAIGNAERTFMTDESYVEAEAYAQAAAEAQSLLSLVVCPQCKKRNTKEWAQFQRSTRITQAKAVVVWSTVIAWQIDLERRYPIVYFFLLVLCVLLTLFLIGYFRRRHADLAARTVRFLSAEELGAEAAQAAIQVAEREKARLARARHHANAPKKRSKFK